MNARSESCRSAHHGQFDSRSPAVHRGSHTATAKRGPRRRRQHDHLSERLQLLPLVQRDSLFRDFRVGRRLHFNGWPRKRLRRRPHRHRSSLGRLCSAPMDLQLWPAPALRLQSIAVRDRLLLAHFRTALPTTLKRPRDLRAPPPRTIVMIGIAIALIACAGLWRLDCVSGTTAVRTTPGAHQATGGNATPAVDSLYIETPGVSARRHVPSPIRTRAPSRADRVQG
jgi:hypothetical protein